MSNLNKERNEMYDELSRILTEYEEGNCDADDLYHMLIKVQTSWADIITATDN